MSLPRRALQAVVGASELAITPLSLVADEIALQRGSLAETDHRPWPLPERPWLQGQTWRRLLFAHWPVEPASLRRLIPRPLELHLYGGEAWLGITPFVLTGARPRGAAPIPVLSRFPELNVRTYVEFEGKPGIYFFSLDAAHRSAVAAARRTYRLPYFHADMQVERAGDVVRYRSRRVDESGPSAELRLRYQPTGSRLPVEEGSRERWLAERYCAYVVGEGARVFRVDIHHPPWPLQPAAADIEVNTMAEPLGVELEGEPLLHYSARQDTLIWSLEPAG